MFAWFSCCPQSLLLSGTTYQWIRSHNPLRTFQTSRKVLKSYKVVPILDWTPCPCLVVAALNCIAWLMLDVSRLVVNINVTACQNDAKKCKSSLEVPPYRECFLLPFSCCFSIIIIVRHKSHWNYNSIVFYHYVVIHYPTILGLP